MAEKRRVPDDVVEYYLFPVVEKRIEEEEKTLAFLEEQQDLYLAHLSSLLVDCIWQNEPFRLRPVADDCVNLPPHLYGTTNFGDNVEDEWFIVYMLFHLTKHFPGLVARVNDNDEEFLLIEAAKVLPKWLNPETAENRVYIYDGELHIIPIPQTPEEVTLLPLFTPSIEDGVACVRECSQMTRSSGKIQQAIQNRINSFPEKITSNFHYAHCYLPASLAAILQERPDLLAAGVQTFYYRDPIDLQACQTMQYFRPGTRITARIKFTKCLYAQLVQQKFQPHRKSGWLLPSINSPKFKAVDLGMKLAHGFEMLCSRCADGSRKRSNNINNNVPNQDVRWKKYVKTLTDKGYFKNELDGSKLYKELVERARKFFLDNIQNKNGRANDPGNQVFDLLDSVQYDIEEMRKAESTLLPPDADGWLDLSPDDVDDMIKNAAGENPCQTDNAFDFSQVAESMKSFVDNVSGLEGAEFPRDCIEGDIGFDSTGFIHAMQKMFEFDDADSESSSDLSEYGWDEMSNDGSPSKKHNQKSASEMDKYLEQMDRELAKTHVGKSFERKPKNRHVALVSTSSSKDIDEEDDDFQPVNVDATVVKNMLESYSAQQGLPGPASNILNSMGLNLAHTN